MKVLRILLKTGLWISGSFALLIGILLIVSECLKLTPEHKASHFSPPAFTADTLDGTVVFGSNFITTIRPNLYLLYIEGNPYERGYAAGLLSKELIARQEKYFVAQIRQLIPNERYLRVLRYFIRLFNFRLDKVIPGEYLEEINGVSQFADAEYNFIGNPYERLINYHAAHDIGHALENMGLVPGCTAMAFWNQFTTDSSMLVARNFDFYVGEDFAREKILLVCRPDSGLAFASVTWGGMMGVVSGMNQAGVTVTINAARSALPLSAQLPVSLLAREILQYASTLDEATAIARSRRIFVSEAILVASAKENKALVIECTPSACKVFLPENDKILYTNHFQGYFYRTDSLNVQNIRESASAGRLLRLTQLTDSITEFNPTTLAALLRNPNTLGGKPGGFGNEQALNQFVAHHSVVFEPGTLRMWLSAGPYQLGEYVALDVSGLLNNTSPKPLWQAEIPLLTIPVDSTLLKDYKMHTRWLQYKDSITSAMRANPVTNISKSTMEYYIDANPLFFGSWVLAGDYFVAANKYPLALEYYHKALACQLPSLRDKSTIEEKIKYLTLK